MDYGLKEMNEMAYDLKEMNEMDCDESKGDTKLSDDVMMELKAMKSITEQRDDQNPNLQLIFSQSIFLLWKQKSCSREHTKTAWQINFRTLVFTKFPYFMT